MKNRQTEFMNYFEASKDLIKPELIEEWRQRLERESQTCLEGSIDQLCALTIVSATVEAMKDLSEGFSPRVAEESIHSKRMNGLMAKNSAQNVYYLHPRGKEFKKYWCRE